MNLKELYSINLRSIGFNIIHRYIYYIGRVKEVK